MSNLRSRQHGQISAGDLAARLRGRAQKLTGPRQAVLEILRREDHPLSIKQIFSRMGKGGSDLATVYRSMHLLERVGMVKRYDLGDGIARYELLYEGDDGHHHHLVCTRCSGVIEIEDCLLAELDQQIAARNGFKSVTHRLEFFGVCPQCQ